jgi:hypothetical protein
MIFVALALAGCAEGTIGHAGIVRLTSIEQK